MPEFLGHKFHIRVDMLEEYLIACAQVIEPFFAIRGSDKAVLGTFPVAGKAHFAFAAIARKGIEFVQPKLSLL